MVSTCGAEQVGPATSRREGFFRICSYLSALSVRIGRRLSEAVFGRVRWCVLAAGSQLSSFRPRMKA